MKRRAIPTFAAAERDETAALCDGPFENHVRVDADELALDIRVAIARARCTWFDVAHHRARIASDLVADGIQLGNWGIHTDVVQKAG